MTRPRSISTLALVLALLGLASLQLIASYPSDTPLTRASQLLRIDPGVASRVLLGAAVILCATAMTASYALWRMRLWAPLVYLAMSASLMVYLALWICLIGSGPLLAALAPCALLLLAGLYWGWRIVHRTFAPLIEGQ